MPYPAILTDLNSSWVPSVSPFVGIIQTLSQVTNRGVVLRPIQGSPCQWPHAFGGIQRDRRGGYSVSIPFNWSERVSISTHIAILYAKSTNSMDYMYNACSTTARRGALDWAPIFEKTNLPVFEKLYESVKNGTETRKALEFNGRATYRQDLARELKEIDDQEIWRAGKIVI